MQCDKGRLESGRVNGLIKDTWPHRRREVTVLGLVLESGAGAELARDGGSSDPALLNSRLAARLHDEEDLKWG